ncbi:hypothetical protein [Cephaloticoccus capnophilus]|uniref:hypothetical protein n=1 Tax=Cephaloticoccus capnophilus TaxID=1548208 RepID=UPI0012E7B922|nr:hypothetical protein [Cephaloticoccus capnophilus]
MNTKYRITFVMQPGGFGPTGAFVSIGEGKSPAVIEDAGWPKRRNGEPISVRCAEAPATAGQAIDNQNWIRTVISLPKALGRSVWSPLARRGKPLRAA